MKTVGISKKNGGPASDRLEARVAPDLKKLFQRAADLQGVTLSDFLISSLHRAALEIVQQHDLLRLGQRDSAAFAAALLQPPAPNARLKAAGRRYKKLSAI